MSRPPRTLHITNGGSAVHMMKQAELPGEFLSWDDPLHDGPAPAGLTLSQFSARRAEFLAESGFEALEETRRRFNARDEVLAGFTEFAEVVLWFEHDLYDQLQLIQILDWLGGRRWQATRLSLVQSGSHLGEIPAERFPELLLSRQPVTRNQVNLAQSAWAAFTSPDPTEIDRARRSIDSSLPYLAAALRRQLEEFPSTADGLGRTERQILEAVAGGKRDPVSLFQANQRMEEAAFLGDWGFWVHIEDLLRGAHPLLSTTTGPFQRPPRYRGPLYAFRNQRVQLTADGIAVLDGRADRVLLNGYDRWMGGARVRHDGHLWRWDRQLQALIESRSPRIP